MNPLKKSLALLIFDAGGFKDKTKSPQGKGYTLKLHEKNPNAPLSPFYIMLRTPDNPKPGPFTPGVIRAIGQQLYEYAESIDLEYDCVAGIPNAGDPIAEAFYASIPSEKGIRLIKLGKVAGGNGRRIKGIVEGKHSPGDHVLLIDDLVTQADTKKEAAAEVKNEGLIVAAILVLVDREQGGATDLRKSSYNFQSVFTVSELLDIYLESGRISQEMFNEIKKYLAENN